MAKIAAAPTMEEIENISGHILETFYRENHGRIYGLAEMLYFAYQLGQKELQDASVKDLQAASMQ